MPRPMDRDQRYHNYNHNEFRPIRQAFSSLCERRATEERPVQHPPVTDTSVLPSPDEQRVVLEHPRVPFRGQQKADFLAQKLSPICRGFRLKVALPSDPYWRAGFVLAPADYIREGSSDIEITQFFLFHLGRDNGGGPTEGNELHYRAYYNAAPVTQWIPFGNASAGLVVLDVQLGVGGGCRVASTDGTGFVYSTVILQDYVSYLYILAWADGRRPFRIPIALSVR